MKVNSIANIILASGIMGFFIASCANVRQPIGGQQDTIPPKLVTSVPQMGDINYRGKKFAFTFDEYTQPKNLKQKLLITPQTDVRYDFKMKKKSLIITFEEPLEENTTYNFNFQDAIQDINENNPWKNSVFAFSTGDYIDSLEISGQVTELMTGLPVKEATVVLFDVSDSLNIFTGKPEYFAKTDEEGFYKLSYIRNGNFRAYAFLDANNNLLNDAESEPSAFLTDTLSLTESQENLDFQLLLVDGREFHVNSAKPSGKYFDVIFNKYVTEYEVNFLNPDEKVLHDFSVEHNGVRFFNPELRSENDSIAARIIAKDSVNNEGFAEVFIKFSESRRKYGEFLTEIVNTNHDNPVAADFSEKIRFNKPIREVHPDSMLFAFDTLNFLQIDIEKELEWNENFNEVTIRKNIGLDSIFLPPADTLFLDSLKADSIYINQPSPIVFKEVSLVLPKGAFISVESDSSEAISQKFSLARPEDLGSIAGRVITNYPKYKIQALSQDYKLVKELEPSENGDYLFQNLKPGTYRLRLLIDENENGVWEYGNMLKNESPEPVYIYPEEIAIRANWELTNIDLVY
ncbi:Ig-like domain-containing protein [Persicobacter sp. CCB-QB2]|uniref:Ig-like domain-containing protein n=1 Tax=Persicobacter sp. CCB-QB2 TaxID=1561025 RepID=UPI0006A9A5C2|nr:Ig-like domain-containing protein [Persicobacter sp. CCB-QB2]